MKLHILEDPEDGISSGSALFAKIITIFGDRDALTLKNTNWTINQTIGFQGRYFIKQWRPRSTVT